MLFAGGDVSDGGTSLPPKADSAASLDKLEKPKASASVQIQYSLGAGDWLIRLPVKAWANQGARSRVQMFAGASKWRT